MTAATMLLDDNGAAVVCPLCRQRRGCRVVESSGAYVLHCCLACDLVFSFPMKSAHADWYDKTYVIRHLAVDDRLLWYFSWALDHLPKQGRLLDVACGTGAFVYYARQRGLDAHGVDFSAEAIEAGRRRFQLETLHAMSAEEFRHDQGDRQFDVVSVFEVIEHVESPVEFLTGIKALVKPGGYVVFSVPNRDRWPLRDFGDYPPNHLTRWTISSMKTLINQVGLEIVQLRTTPVWFSMNLFYGYWGRVALYKLMSLHSQGLAESGERKPVAEIPVTRQRLGRWLSALRRFRDGMMWVPTIVFFPFFYPFFRGYNVVGILRNTSSDSTSPIASAQKPV